MTSKDYKRSRVSQRVRQSFKWTNFSSQSEENLPSSKNVEMQRFLNDIGSEIFYSSCVSKSYSQNAQQHASAPYHADLQTAN